MLSHLINLLKPIITNILMMLQKDIKSI